MILKAGKMEESTFDNRTKLIASGIS